MTARCSLLTTDTGQRTVTRFMEIRMNRALAMAAVTVLSAAAGGCCCLREPCPDPCPPPCPAPCAPAVGAPVIPPGGTYAPVPFQGANPRPESAGNRGPIAANRGPVSTMFETLRSWTLPSADIRPFGLHPSTPARPLAVTQ
jgi:hypothetical protein